MSAEGDRPPLLAATGLSKSYRQRRWGRVVFRVAALADVDLELHAGRTTALVGASGSGKSTLGRCLALLEAPDAGRVLLRGRDLVGAPRPQRRAAHREIQLIFQDAAGALNPRFTAVRAVAEPLEIAARGGRRERRELALETMRLVGLPAAWAERRPLELSGGQRQRLAIARALVLEPRVLVLDEAFSGLDLSVQAQIVNLLQELQQRLRLAMLLISHDFSLVGYLADEVAVLDGGRVIERGAPAALFARPRHPRTAQLVAATPLLTVGEGAG